MNAEITDRRRYTRYIIEDGSLFSDKHMRIGYGKIVNISKGGTRCLSLSPVRSSEQYVWGVQLYMPNLDLVLDGLCGKIKELNRIPIQTIDSEIHYFYDFRFEFLSMLTDLPAESYKSCD